VARGLHRQIKPEESQQENKGGSGIRRNAREPPLLFYATMFAFSSHLAELRLVWQLALIYGKVGMPALEYTVRRF
jgi:hypothetical protein